jgi:hypothetical protein
LRLSGHSVAGPRGVAPQSNALTRLAISGADPEIPAGTGLSLSDSAVSRDIGFF